MAAAMVVAAVDGDIMEVADGVDMVTTIVVEVTTAVADTIGTPIQAIIVPDITRIRITIIAIHIPITTLTPAITTMIRALG